MKTIQLFFLVILFSACGKSKAGDADTTKPSSMVRVLSYNIHHASPPDGPTTVTDLAAIAAVIKKQTPDLVALQEVDVNTNRSTKGVDQAAELAKLTGLKHYYFSKSIDYEGGEYGVAILSRYPILEKQRFELPMPDGTGEKRTAAVVVVDLGEGEKIRFLSTHLDVKSNRVAQAEELVKISKGGTLPMIIAGDFNAEMASPEIQELRKEFTPGCISTCPLTSPAIKPAKTIDYVMQNPAAAKKFQVFSYIAITGQYASDHLPVLQVFSK